MNVGAVFEYLVKIEQSDGTQVTEFSEKYELLSKNAEKLVFKLSGGPNNGEEIIGNTLFASGIFDISSLRRSGSETIGSGTYSIDADVYISDLCGGSETVWVGPENVAYKDVKTQLWSRGVVHKETRMLVAFIR